MSMIEIIEYSDNFAKEFKRLNLEWLDKYHLTESHDLKVLDDPRGTILNSGGVIYLAQAAGEIVGTAALIKEHDGIFELAKMAVTTPWQGKGIGKLLIEKCIGKSKELGAKKLCLFSNHQLHKAIDMYGKFGFEHVPIINSPFTTADVKMELLFE